MIKGNRVAAERRVQNAECRVQSAAWYYRLALGE